jgi:glycosyl transferase family 25
MKLLLINLARDEDRLAASRKRFSELGLGFERLEGYNGHAMSEEDFQTFIAPRPRDGKYHWTRGKVGCFLSHSRAWKMCADGPDDYVAIFEDDLHISDELPYFLNNLSWMPKDFDIIRMESPTNRIKVAKVPTSENRGRKIFQVQSTAWCAGSYARCAGKISP